MRIKTINYSQSRPQGSIVERSTERGWESDGLVFTNHGVVQVISDTYRKNGDTTLRFVHNGRHYIRFIDRYYTPRGLVTLAARFAKEIASC